LLVFEAFYLKYSKNDSTSLVAKSKALSQDAFLLFIN